MSKTAATFFSSLYEDQPVDEDGDFDLAVTKLTARQGTKAVASDQALQSLMINYILSSPENSEKGKDIAAAVAGIKQRSVNDFVATYPGISLDDLIEQARASGHHVEVLSK